MKKLFRKYCDKFLGLFFKEKDYLSILEESGVPKNLHDEAISSIKESRYRFFTDVIFYKASAWLVVAFAVPFMKWEDNELPKPFRRWGNNISPHGDALTWGSEKGYPAHEKAPLDKAVRHNAAGQPLCYYRKGNPHVREKMSMYVWMGQRNPGAGRALQMGESVKGLVFTDGESSWNVNTWGDMNTSKTHYGVRVHNIGNHWQLERCKEWKRFKFRGETYAIGFDSNFGFKINNLYADYHPKNPDARICVYHAVVPYIKKIE